MATASIIYWYGGDNLRLDGGGLRARAWEVALTDLGYETRICGLWSIGGGMARGGSLSRVKRAIIPMPFTRPAPAQSLDADLVVATVPATFDDALGKVSSGKLVFDWMDLWSVNARNVGDAHPLSRVGGRIQSSMWARRERRLADAQIRAHTYAGWGDFAALDSVRKSPGSWLPTPVATVAAQGSRGGVVRSVGFVGNLDYPPNRLSLRWFLERYSAQLAAKNIRVVIAGFGSGAVASWGYDVEVMGEIDSVEELYSCVDAAIVPVNFGGGIKVKAVEAMSYGLPVFATPHVRSGFSAEFAAYLPDLDDLVAGVEAEPVPPELFQRAFSRSAFRARVEELVD